MVRISSARINMESARIDRAVLKDYGEVLVGGVAGIDATGYALDFDGVDDTVTVSANSVFNTDNLSVSMWVKPDTLRIQGLISKGSFASSWRIFMSNTGGTIEFDARSDVDNVDSVGTLTAGSWAHVVVTYNKAITTAIIYFNGSVTDTNASFANAGNDVSGAITIAPNTTNEFDGHIDDVRIYNTPLTSTEVTALYNGGEVTRGLVARWEFSEGTGSTTDDTSLNSNTGTINGATWAISSYHAPSYTIDLSAGNVHHLILSRYTRLAFSNPTTPGTAYTFTLYLQQDSVGSNILTSWPASVVWPSGNVPVLTTTPNYTDVFTFLTVDGGNTWFGFV